MEDRLIPQLLKYKDKSILEENLESWKKFKKTKSKIDEKIIKNKIKDRENARKKGDYKLADSIRKDLESAGIIIEDKGDKTNWKYKHYLFT